MHLSVPLMEDNLFIHNVGASIYRWYYQLVFGDVVGDLLSDWMKLSYVPLAGVFGNDEGGVRRLNKTTCMK